MAYIVMACLVVVPEPALRDVPRKPLAFSWGKRLKTVKALLVTDRGRQPALLSADDASNDGLPVLIAEGVAYTPDDLPLGAYLEVDESEMADLAAVAGYVLEPPHTVKRRLQRLVGKFIAVGILASAGGALIWAVKSALALDLLAALMWVVLSLVLGVFALGWWSYADEIMLEKEARTRRTVRKRLRLLGSLRRRQ